ncbi:CoA-binding protein [Actinomadura rayongensis]|uniref:CoA-binding protein n=1 Tax=Actinomadura rayongensis TaxID=1429076 RepID=A0A6I4W8V7_9ACTN|nr:CoA-binding protein [Actinomadura rayongensis]MXQ64695.1 CoA-binding protein [Actinomadura rayongensis]
MSEFADDVVIGKLLEAKTWAFVGLDGNPLREVYRQARLMQRAGARIIPVHPDRKDVLGETTYASLDEVPGPIDVVAVYRRSEFAGAVIDQAVAAGAGAVWTPLDVVDEDAARRAQAAGLDVVMNRCPAVERHRRAPR